MATKYPKRFFKGTDHKARMIQAWLILIGKARNHQKITYEELSVLMFGTRAPRHPAMRLGALFAYCEDRNLPLLPVIVVTKKTWTPARDAPYDASMNAKTAAVFNYDWYGIHPPCEADLHD
jgi:hypothetical protein